MIKRYNENWGPIKNNSRYHKSDLPIMIDSKEGDSVNFSIEMALKISKKENNTVILNIDGVELSITPTDNVEELLKTYNTYVKYAENNKDYWKDYWEEKSSDPDFEMDTIDDYAMRHNISRTEAEKFFKSNPKFQKGNYIYDYAYRMYGIIVDYNPKKENCYLIDFTDGTSVWLPEKGLIKISTSASNLKTIIGLPSGQVLYMSEQQIKYFKARGQITYKKNYKKTIGDQIENVNLEEYTFKDSDYNQIILQMDLFTWR